MLQKINKHPLIFRAISLIAILFGLATIKSGGMVLFTSGAAHQAAGQYVPFVLWFNFSAGFAYLVAGAGLWLQQRWASWLALIIATFTLLIFAALGVYIYSCGAYEMRTIMAMTMRSTVWIVIAFITIVIARHHSESSDSGDSI